MFVKLVCPFLVAVLLGGCAEDRPAPYFPRDDADWETVRPGTVGWDAAAIELALDYAGRRHSSAVLVAHRGRILAERYWRLDEDTRFGANGGYGVMGRFQYDDHGRPIEDVASVQKSVVAFLVFVARHKGLVALDSPVTRYVGEGWSGATSGEERAITIRHLMAMSSGLTPGLAFEAPAGTKWFYNTRAYSQLLDVLEVTSGLTPDEFTRSWLTEPTGMTSTGWRRRAWWTDGMEANHVGFGTGARDLARFGLLAAADGFWNGVDLVGDSSGMREAFAPSQSMNPSYGLLWWINDGSEWEDWDHRGMRAGRFIDTAPEDMVVARGVGDRRLYVVPSLDLVVVRLGAPTIWRDDGTSDLNTFDRELWRLLMAAAPN